MPFPSTLSTFNRPNATDRLNSPSHSALHNTVSSALGQVEAVVGVDGTSSVVGTMMYDIRSPASKGGGHVQGAAFGGTGQTNFTKGDMLVAQSASVISKLAVGSNTFIIVADSTTSVGIKWATPTASVLGIATPVVRVYTASSIAGWSKPSLLSHIIVEGVGAGGGGGSGGASNGYGAGGGGGGGYSRKLIKASVLSASENIVIGAAGAAGVAGAGAAGGTTVFGASSLISATGGGGGNRGANSGSAGGLGGIGSNGDVNIQGGPGDPGAALFSGSGGNSYFGGGGNGVVSETATAGGVYGGGGSGATRTGSEVNGGIGAVGLVVVTEYYI